MMLISVGQTMLCLAAQKKTSRGLSFLVEATRNCSFSRHEGCGLAGWDGCCARDCLDCYGAVWEWKEVVENEFVFTIQNDNLKV